MGRASKCARKGRKGHSSTRRAARGRGKIKRIRTKKLPGGRYAHVAVVSKKGPRGGTTVMGKVRKKKRKRKKH